MTGNPRERSLLERILYTILALALIVLGFFFLAAALVAGGILAAVILIRFWWIQRKLRTAAEEEFVAAEYTVVERESQAGPRLPPDSRESMKPPMDPVRGRASNGVDADERR